MNRYIVKVFFTNNEGVDVETIPVFEKSKETIEEKLRLNSNEFDDFCLYNYDWNSNDYKNLGVQIMTVDEFFGDSNNTGW